MNVALPKHFIVFLSLVLLALILLSFFTPSFANSANDHIVVSEIQNNISDEFVELYNPTEVNVDITGWTLMKKANSPDSTPTNLVAGGLVGTIPAKGYFLIAKAESYTGVVLADQTYVSTIGNNNTIYLYDNSDPALLIDKVGFGDANDYETSPAQGLVAGSIRRVNNQDSDDNSVDFEALEVSNPQNSLFIASPSPTVSPTPSPSPTATVTPIQTPTPTPSPSPSPVATSSPTPKPNHLALFRFPRSICRMEVMHIRVGFLNMPFAKVTCEQVQ